MQIMARVVSHQHLCSGYHVQMTRAVLCCSDTAQQKRMDSTSEVQRMLELKTNIGTCSHYHNNGRARLKICGVLSWLYNNNNNYMASHPDSPHVAVYLWNFSPPKYLTHPSINTHGSLRPRVVLANNASAHTLGCVRTCPVSSPTCNNLGNTRRSVRRLFLCSCQSNVHVVGWPHWR